MEKLINEFEERIAIMLCKCRRRRGDAMKRRTFAFEFRTDRGQLVYGMARPFGCGFSFLWFRRDRIGCVSILWRYKNIYVRELGGAS